MYIIDRNTRAINYIFIFNPESKYWIIKTNEKIFLL